MTFLTHIGRTFSLFIVFLSLAFHSAWAGDIIERGSIKDDPLPVSSDRPVLTTTLSIASQYITDGIQQTEENAAIQGSFDLTYKMFYLGVWASNLDFGGDANGNDIANIEIDVYGGIKHQYRGLTLDLGFIYYGYPSAEDQAGEFDFIEAKFGVSGDLTDRIHLGVTTFYTPEYFGEAGDVWSFLGDVAVDLGTTYGRFSHSVTGQIGYLDFLDNSSRSYTYWNIGLKTSFDRYTLDLRYWDTDINNLDIADEQFVAKLSSTF